MTWFIDSEPKSPDLWKPRESSAGFPVGNCWDVRVTAQKGWVCVEYSHHDKLSEEEDMAISNYLHRMSANLRVV